MHRGLSIPLPNRGKFKLNDPSLSLENFVAQYGGPDLSLRSKSFEEYVAKIWQEGTQQPVIKGLKYFCRDSTPIELDIVLYWQGYLILSEVKCLKSIFDSADEYKAYKHVEYSIEQLLRRKELIHEEWEEFIASAPGLHLPTTPIAHDLILCVSVSNLMRFTGYEMRGVVLTDSWCLKRYFGDPEIAAMSFNGKDTEYIGSGGYIRTTDPNPVDLIAYLRNPPQVSRVLKNTHVKPSVLYPFEEGGKAIIYAASQYNPPA